MERRTKGKIGWLREKEVCADECRLERMEGSVEWRGEGTVM